MSSSADALWFQRLYDSIDLVLVPVGGFAYAYHIFGLAFAGIVLALHVVLLYFTSLYFSAIALTSFFVAHVFVYKKALATASESMQFYTTLALCAVFIAFGIAALTGWLEPYQAALICVAFYIIQSRYRTSTLTMKALEEQRAADPSAFMSRSASLSGAPSSSSSLPPPSLPSPSLPPSLPSFSQSQANASSSSQPGVPDRG